MQIYGIYKLNFKNYWFFDYTIILCSCWVTWCARWKKIWRWIQERGGCWGCNPNKTIKGIIKKIEKQKFNHMIMHSLTFFVDPVFEYKEYWNIERLKDLVKIVLRGSSGASPQKLQSFKLFRSLSLWLKIVWKIFFVTGIIKYVLKICT